MLRRDDHLAINTADACGDTPAPNTGGDTEPTGPSVAAADPTATADSVLSVFGTTYGNLATANFDPSWGQATDAVAGDVYVLNGLDYQGVDFGGNQDASAYAHIHLDYYTADSTALQVFLISPGTPAVETPYTLDVSATDQWVSVDIPLADFAPVDMANVFLSLIHI